MLGDNVATPSFGHTELHHLRHIWGCLVALGISLVVVGFAAIAFPVAATFTTVTVFGILLLVGAAVELASMIWVRRWRPFFHHLLSGFLYFFLGLILLDRPGLGAAGYTLVIAFFLVASGVTRVAFALGHPGPGRRWTVLSGIVSVLLGATIWRELPEAAYWVIGTFVGVELALNGMTWLTVGLAVRRLPKSVVPAPANQMAHV